MDIVSQKKQLRERIKQLKSSLSLQDKREFSERIFNKIEKYQEFIDSKVILLYWSMPDEVQTHDFILKWYKNKTIILPCVKGNNLELKEFEGIENLIPGEAYGILEPKGKIFTQHDKIDLVIAPGIAFDKKNNRMGRGKAYYDKLLVNIDCKKFGICFSFQHIDFVPYDEFDIKMDEVISS